MSQHLLDSHFGGFNGVLEDANDLIADTSEIKIASEVDPRPDMTPIYDQLQLGSCTANAAAAAFDYDRIANGEEPVFPSRLGIYFGERKREHSPLDQDTGAWGRDGLWVEQHVGVWPEKLWPYSDQTSDPHFYEDPASKLGPAQVKLEGKYKAVRRRIHDFQAVLSNRQTILIGFQVYQSFESAEVAKSGIMPVPQRGERLLGGHEVLVCGYLRSEPHYALVRNSWSTGWGIEGYFLMPWAVLLDPSMSSDFRTIYRPLAA